MKFPFVAPMWVNNTLEFAEVVFRPERMNPMENSHKMMRLRLSFNLIQEIRLTHALMESDWRVCLEKKHSYKFLLFKKKFKIAYSTKISENIPCLPTEISHRIPFTRIGSIQKPLIFPHDMFHYLRNKWPKKKRFVFSFAGLLTQRRMDFFNSWLGNFDDCENLRLKLLGKKTLAGKILREIFNTTLLSVYNSGKYNILFIPNTRGRGFPIKSWDEKYYEHLLNSRFVLCPEGDYSWSYRFFESIMCGAIPIVESYHPSYEGFIFFRKEDAVNNLEWNENIITKNYHRCYQLLTVPVGDLNKEISKLLGTHFKNDRVARSRSEMGVCAARSASGSEEVGFDRD